MFWVQGIFCFLRRKRGRMTKETRTQWHPAFCSAMRLELIENKADLDYTKGKRNPKRILWSNDGLIFVSFDHYQTFYEITDSKG